MSKRKIETMTLAEIEEQIRVLKEQKSRTAEREKQEHKKLLTHRKIQLGGTLSSVLADSGIDICSIDKDIFEKEMLPKLHSYYVKYALFIKKMFIEENGDADTSEDDKDTCDEAIEQNSYSYEDADNDKGLSFSFLDTDDDSEDM